MANIKYGKRNQAEFMRLSEKKKKKSTNWQMLSLDGDMENQMH